MRYGQQDISVVDFPGEYDIRGHAVTCYATDNLLHYIINVDDTRYAIIQDAGVISKETFDQIDVRVVVDEDLKIEIERQELEGKVQLISDLIVEAAAMAEQKRIDREAREAEKLAEREARIAEKEAAKIVSSVAVSE
jgi:hypothetical protein